MSNKRLEIMDLKQLLQLKAAGQSNRSIGEILGRSRNTINEYVQLFAQCPQSIEELSQLSLSDLYKLVSKVKIDNEGESSARYIALEKHKDRYLRDYTYPQK